MQHELSVTVIFKTVRRKWFFFLLGLASCFMLSIAYLHLATRSYTVSMQVTAANPQQAMSNSKLAGLSSLAGIDLTGGGNGGTFKVYVASLQSPAVAAVLARQPHLLHELFPREWSPDYNRWEAPPPSFFGIPRALGQLLGLTVTPWSPPTPSRIAEYLSTELLIVQDDRTGIVTLKIESNNPQTAIDLLLAVNAAADGLMRERSLSRADGYIQYITDVLPKVTVAEYRNALVENLAQQVGIRIMAHAGVPFISDVLSGPTVSPYPTSPSARTFLILALFLGVLVGTVLALLAERFGWPLQLIPIGTSVFPNARRARTGHVK